MRIVMESTTTIHVYRSAQGNSKSPNNIRKLKYRCAHVCVFYNINDENSDKGTYYAHISMLMLLCSYLESTSVYG